RSDIYGNRSDSYRNRFDFSSARPFTVPNRHDSGMNDARSAEDVAHLVHETLVAEVFLFDLRELFEEFALLARQSRRRHHSDRDEEVAAPAPAERGHALTLHAEDRAGLCA